MTGNKCPCYMCSGADDCRVKELEKELEQYKIKEQRELENKKEIQRISEHYKTNEFIKILNSYKH